MAKIKKSPDCPKHQLPNILIKNPDPLKVAKIPLKRMIRLVLKSFKIDCEALAVHFVSKKAISKLHLDFFNDPTPTDCISFPIDQPSLNGKCAFLGEIFVCPSVAYEYATKNDKDPYIEIILYVIHGLLHLFGFDDLSTHQKKKMRKKERECLKLLAKNHLIDENALNIFLSPKRQKL